MDDLVGALVATLLLELGILRVPSLDDINRRVTIVCRWTKPADNLSCALINALHELNLLVPIINVTLIDAYSIDPECKYLGLCSKVLQGHIETFGNKQSGTVYRYWSSTCWIAPNIRESREPGGIV